MARWTVEPDQTLPARVAQLAEQVERDGGHTLAVYQEPVGEHWQIFCLLPLSKVEPTPYQRDLSPTHMKRLLTAVKKLDRFIDPIVVMSAKPIPMALPWDAGARSRATSRRIIGRAGLSEPSEVE